MKLAGFLLAGLFSAMTDPELLDCVDLDAMEDKLDYMIENNIDPTFFVEGRYIPIDYGKSYHTIEFKKEGYRITSITYNPKDDLILNQFNSHRRMFKTSFANKFFFDEVNCYLETNKYYLMYKYRLVPKTFYAEVKEFKVDQLLWSFLSIVDIFNTFEKNNVVFTTGWSFSTPFIDDGKFKLPSLSTAKIYELGRKYYVNAEAAPDAEGDVPACQKGFVKKHTTEESRVSVTDKKSHRLSLFEFMRYIITLRFTHPISENDRILLQHFSEMTKKVDNFISRKKDEDFHWSEAKEFVENLGKSGRLLDKVNSKSRSSSPSTTTTPSSSTKPLSRKHSGADDSKSRSPSKDAKAEASNSLNSRSRTPEKIKRLTNAGSSNKSSKDTKSRTPSPK